MRASGEVQAKRRSIQDETMIFVSSAKSTRLLPNL